MSDWIGSREAADLLGVSQRTILDYCESRLFVSARQLKPQGHWKIDRQEVLQLLKRYSPNAFGVTASDAKPAKTAEPAEKITKA